MGAKKCVVEVISTTVIKPSSPTPESKRRVKLSLVDQRVPRIYAPMIYCYNTPTLTTFAIQQSLSKTLELFYPFAGQLSRDFTSIECTDHGAYFLEATTDSRLSDFLRNPDHKAVGRLIPSSDPKTMREATRNNVVTLVQLTGFSCGGIAIGVEVSHKIADGFSVACFSKAWAAISAGIRDVAPPAFSSSDLLHSPDSHVFPIKRIDPAPLQVPLRSRMFIFSSAKLAVLKEEIKQKGQVNFRPSTLEAVSSLLFRCIAEAAGASALLQMVDMRTRLTSPPVNCIGNISWPLFVYSGENKRSMELHEIAGIIRKVLDRY